jgi:hypothetical protein
MALKRGNRYIYKGKGKLMNVEEHRIIKDLITALGDCEALPISLKPHLRATRALLRRPREAYLTAALSEIGRRGGAKLTPRKLASCRANALKGGRPPKSSQAGA